MPRVKIDIDNETMRLLQESAEKDSRTLGAQARLILRHILGLEEGPPFPYGLVSYDEECPNCHQAIPHRHSQETQE